MRVRDRLTSATATLMQRHGVAGTGIAEILATSGVTRRSIYLNFPGGKAELVAAATRSAGDEMTATGRPSGLETPSAWTRRCLTRRKADLVVAFRARSGS